MAHKAFQNRENHEKNYDTLLLDADDTLLDFGKTEKAALENTFDDTA